jgi:hypothetical protein
MANPEIPPFPKRGDYAQNWRGEQEYKRATQDWQTNWGGAVKAQAQAALRESGAAATASEEELRKKQALRDYIASPTGQNMDLAKNLAFLTGAPSVGANYLIGKTAPAGTSKLGRLARFGGYGLEAVAELELARHEAASQPSALDNPYGHDTNQVVQNALYGMTAGPAIAGWHKAFSTTGQPAETPAGPSQNALAPAPSLPASPAPAPAPVPEPAPLSGAEKGSVTRSINMGASRLEEAPNAAVLMRAKTLDPKAKASNARAIITRENDSIAGLAPADLEAEAKAAGIETANLSRGRMMTALMRAKTFGVPAAIATGAGALGAALSPDQAEASIMGVPGAQETDTLTVPQTRGERIVRGLGRAGDAMRAVPGQLLDETRNLPQSIRENTPGFQGGDLGYTPEEMQAILAEQNLRLAQAGEARQMAEMRQSQFAAQPRQYPENQPPIDPGSVPPSLRRFVAPGQTTPLGNLGGAPVQGMRPEAGAAPGSSFDEALARLTQAIMAHRQLLGAQSQPAPSNALLRP